MNYLLTFALLLQAAALDEPRAAAETEAAAETDAASEEAPDDESAETPVPTDEAPASDDEEDAADEKGFFDYGAIGLLIDGGWFMLPILIMGIIAAGVIIERYRSLKLLTTDSSAVRAEVRQLLGEDRVEEALELCEREQGPVPAILSAGLRKFLVLDRLNYDPGRIEEQVVKAMDDYSVHVVAALEKHLPVLATVSSAAPMLGFLGTVSGMITSFNDIVEKMGETNIVEAAADGISVALLTTCFGLIIGIPAFIAFNYYTSVINRFVLDVEESATELIEVVTLQMALDRQTDGRPAPVQQPAAVTVASED